MYDDDLQPKNGKPQFLKEKVDIDLDKQTEKIQVPQIGGVEDVIVLHDFEVNLTAIVDVNEERCFVLPLDRSVVSPPSDFLDLMLKYMNGAYTPNVRKIRREYQVQYPKLEDLSRLGWYIQNQCFSYDTYRLVASGETQTHHPLLGGDDGHRPSWLATTKRPLLGAPDGHRPAWLGHHHDRDGHRRPHGHDMHGMRNKRSVKKDFKVAVIEGTKAVVEYAFKFE
ncbi:integral membrane protein 2C [Lingula anatina]|uniref:Integral membrane protein 2 n=1 Tax=Lingula anatina TaxID=7574 RepID=A0A1S3H7V1_LINAN|nr:integral membrane protein 2C [Lingula anatina]|eukprot:XP_013382195.1 integral membrane protein 2C [Lingula anatina]